MPSMFFLFEIPASSRKAAIQFYTLDGKQLYSVDISGRQNGTITINANQFAAGTYIYKLVVDGQNVDAKKLVLIR